MEFAWDETTGDWQRRLTTFMDDHVYPAESEFAAQSEQLGPHRHLGAAGRAGRAPGTGQSGRAVEPVPAG